MRGSISIRRASMRSTAKWRDLTATTWYARPFILATPEEATSFGSTLMRAANRFKTLGITSTMTESSTSTATIDSLS